MINYSVFQDAERKPYIETYFSVDGNSVRFEKLENGKYQGGIEVTLSFLDSGGVVLSDRFRLKGPEVKDTTTELKTFLHQGRYTLPSGDYVMQISLHDLQTPDKEHSLEQPVSLVPVTNAVIFSDVQVLESFTKAETPGRYTRSGYDLVPLVSGGVFYLPEPLEKLQFYTELYNADLLGAEAAFLFKYYLEDVSKKKLLPAFTGFQKQKAGTVNPLLTGFDIKGLPSGQYLLHLQALDQKGQVVASAEVPFFRQNNAVEEKLSDYLLAEAGPLFADQLKGDSVFVFIDYLYPISTQAERRMATGILETRDRTTANNFFYTFWKNRDPQSPETAWLEYRRQVNYVNEQFGTRILSGHRTDRGRVFLQYGAPNLTEDRRYESSAYPYEIWQYNRLESASTFPQVNKVFVFALTELAGNNYRLIHSNATGEMFNPRWMNDLLKRDMQSRDLDETFYDYQNPGSRANSNIIINGGNINGINRQ